jgi:hypothetical protein
MGKIKIYLKLESLVQLDNFCPCFTESVKSISKYFQNIESKHLQVIKNLPKHILHLKQQRFEFESNVYPKNNLI